MSDMILNYRSIIALGEKNIESMTNKYQQLLEIPTGIAIKNAHLHGFFFAYSQFSRFGFVALTFYVGSILINTYGDDPKSTYIAIFILRFTCLGSSAAIS
jgi:nitrate/nitrite transporter NarK